MQAYRNFVGEPLRHRSFDLALYRLMQLLHVRSNGFADTAYMALVRRFQTKSDLPAPRKLTAQTVDDIVRNLKKNGYLIMQERLPAADVASLVDFAFATPAIGSDLKSPIHISRDSIPDSEARYCWWMDDLAAVPVVKQLVIDGPFCAIAQEYLGCRPILAHISLFLDRPFEKRFEPYTYHCDNEGPGFLKFFFFLTDVAVGTGAHYFISGTHGHTKPGAFKQGPFYDAEDLHAWYGRDSEIIVQGPAGTILAEDTAGFHRGSPLLHGYRLMMQFEFSAINAPTEQEMTRRLKPIAVPGLHPGTASIVRKFYVAA